MNPTPQDTVVNSPLLSLITALGLIAAGVAFGAAGIYVGEIDDAPGAALIGIVLMIVAVGLGGRKLIRLHRSTKRK